VIFDPETEAALKQRAKAEIRKRMRALRNSIPAGARETRSKAIVERVAGSAAFQRAARIALFAPALDRNEVDVRSLDDLARAAGKLVGYPRLEDAPGEMSFRIARPDALEECGHGILEPGAEAEPMEIDSEVLAIVPALAVGLGGHRIGYGKGYYDRWLTRAVPPATALAVAFDFQLLAEIPTAPWDRAVQWVVTDRGTWETPSETPIEKL
jgi:5-formyltetrahydrofolate cyclo-ligase